MAIQWFPGHMHATRKAISERMKAGIDVVIELLDARLPGSSNNPLLAELTAGKPALKLLNKQDLADPATTALWLDHFNAQPDTRALGLDASESAPAAKLVAASRLLAPLRGGMTKPLRLLICGVPNVGKSTLINTILGKRAAKTGDIAGVTKTEQRIALASDAYLFDTPGMLWPRIVVPETGLLLAASGAVGINAYDEQEVALALLERLQADFPAALEARYKLSGVAALTSDALLEAIARQRGLVQTGGKLNWQKAAEVVIHDFRSGAMGRVSLETPALMAQWQALAAVADAARTERKARFIKPVKVKAVPDADPPAKPKAKPAPKPGR